MGMVGEGGQGAGVEGTGACEGPEDMDATRTLGWGTWGHGGDKDVGMGDMGTRECGDMVLRESCGTWRMWR